MKDLSAPVRSKRRSAHRVASGLVVIAMTMGGLAAFGGAAGASTAKYVPGQYGPKSPQKSEGTILYVDENGDGEYCTQNAPCDSIDEALYVAYESNDVCNGPVTIDVGAGGFYEDEDYSGYFDEGCTPYVTIAGIPGKTAVYDYGDDNFIVNDCGTLTIEGLRMSGYSTAVYNECGTLYLEDDTFTHDGNGVESYDEDGFTQTFITDSTFTDINEDAVNADGDYTSVASSTFYNIEDGIYGDDGDVSVENSTFNDMFEGIDNEYSSINVGNSTFSGAYVDVYNDEDGDLALFGSILTNSYDGDCQGDISDLGYNLQQYDACDWTTPTSEYFEDANLGALQDNGGYTMTQAITPSSYAYNIVPASSCPATDQRGEPRPQPTGSNYCDAGAYEYSAPTTIEFESAPITGPDSYDANNGVVWVEAYDAFGLPAVSQHPMVLDLSTSAPNGVFSLTYEGRLTSSITIPVGSSVGGFYFGDENPTSFPITVTGWNSITDLGTITQTETVVTGPPAEVTATAGTGESTTVGTDYPTDLSVNVVDGTGNPVDDEAVTFTVTTAAGSNSATFPGSAYSATVYTDSSGDATAPALLAGTVPNADVNITATTANDVSTSFDVSQVVGPPAFITIDTGNSQSAISDQAFTNGLSTTVTDEYGNPIVGATVVYDVTHGSATFSGNATDDEVTDINGDSGVDTLTAGNLGGNETITATVEGTTVSTTFIGITIVPLASTARVSIFALGKSTLSAGLKTEIMAMAETIATYGNTTVTLDGYADDSGSTALNHTLSVARATSVKTQLVADLKTLDVTGVTITALGKGATNFINGNGKLPANRRVDATIS